MCPAEPGAGARLKNETSVKPRVLSPIGTKRGDARAPDRSEIEPGAVRELLGDIFVLSYDAAAGYPFRVAGTRVCALLGRDLKDRSFSALFAPDGRREIEEIVAVVAEEMLAAVAGITATSEDGSPAHLELLLLPFNTRAHTPLSLTGLLAPFESEHRVLRDFKLTSWRYLGHRPENWFRARCANSSRPRLHGSDRRRGLRPACAGRSVGVPVGGPPTLSRGARTLQPEPAARVRDP